MRQAQQSWMSDAACYDATARSSHSLASGPETQWQTGGYSNMAAAGGAGSSAQHNTRQAPGSDADAWRSTLGGNRRNHTMSVQYVQAIVRNTFVDVVDPTSAPSGGLGRSASDSDISRSSEEKLHFWLPSLTSSSKESSGELDDIVLERSQALVVPGLHSPSARLQPKPSENQADTGLPWRPHPSDPQLPEVPMELPETFRDDNFGRPLNQQPDAQSRQPVASIDVQHVPLIVRQMHEETGTPLADLLEAHKTHDLSLVPRHVQTGVLASIGSVNHREGGCNPCMFHATKACIKGVTCLFCHFRHRDFRPRRIRPPKKKRDKMKAAANRAEHPECAESSSDDEADGTAASSAQIAPSGHQQELAQSSNPPQPMTQKLNARLRL